MGELLPSHLWEWAKTTTAPEGEAPGELFYAGFDPDVARVSINWRAVVPPGGQELRPPVFAAEAIDVPLWEAREFLEGLPGDRVTRVLRAQAPTTASKASGSFPARPGSGCGSSSRAPTAASASATG